MEYATWYLGPLGDMRPLVVPEPGIKIEEIRYGGVHQGLSGARTMDVTGHRREFEFEFSFLEKDEYAWLEALHTRMVPGPHHLLDPMKRNRLTGQASRLLPIEARNSGLLMWNGTNLIPHSFVRDWPQEVSIPGRAMRVAGWAGDFAFLQFDEKKLVPLLDGETLTTSVYLKGDAAHGAWLRISWYDEDEDFISNSDVPIQISTEWSRHWSTYHEAPVNARGARFMIILGTANTAVYIAAPQLEANNTYLPTEFELGGGAPVVHIDQLPSNSRRFPIKSATLSLLEA